MFSYSLCLLLLFSNGECAIKKWLRNTNYNNSKNWDKGRIPCLTDTVIFPKDLKLPVELPENDMKVFKLILPSDGGLYFPHNGELVLSNTKLHGKCPGGEIKFTRKQIAKWLDYENWQSDSNEATPHTERIPCRYDHVEFPPNSTFYIELPPYSTSISTITIQGKNLSGKAWEELLLSDVGLKEFPVGEWLTATGEKCERQDRCDECADFPTYCRPCPEEQCEDPVKPLGFCCPICGGYLLFEEKDSVINEVRKAVSEFPMKDIVWHVSYISGYVQVVLVQKSNYFNIKNEINELHDYLLNKKLKLQSANFRVSGSMARRQSPSTTFGLFFSYMVAAVLLFIGVIYYYHRNENLSWRDLISYRGGFQAGFVFARFQNLSGVVELGDEHLVGEVDDEEDTSQDVNEMRAFDNPMYGESQSTTLLEGAEFREVPLQEAGENMKLDTFVQNMESQE